MGICPNEAERAEGAGAEGAEGAGAEGAGAEAEVAKGAEGAGAEVAEGAGAEGAEVAEVAEGGDAEGTEGECADGADLDALIHAAGSGATLCWDTETSSLVGHVIQIAIVAMPRGALTTDGTLPGHVSYCRHWFLSKDVELDARAVAVHGITRTHLDKHGCVVLAGLQAIAAVVHAGRVGKAQWVAHNASFNVARLNHTATFHGAPAVLGRDEVVCTMRASSTHCGLKSRTGRAKSPQCDELYTYLYKRPCAGKLHDALADATLLASCFLGGRHRGWW